MNAKEYISSGIIESYILGLASPEEAGIFECVIKSNVEINAAFIEAQQVLEDFATAQSFEPPDYLKDKIWEKIKCDEPIAISIPIIDSKEDVHKKKALKEITLLKRWKSISVAASILFLVSVVSNVFWISSQNKSNAEIDRLQTKINTQNLVLNNVHKKWNMVSHPEIHTVTLHGVEQHSHVKAIVFWHKKSKHVYLHAGNLPKAPAGMQYQLWSITDGKPTSAGLYTHEKDTEVPLAVIEDAEGFAITLEKVGGSDEPTMENMYVMGEV